MPDFSHRSYQTELMDDLSIPPEELHNTLLELDKINKCLGGYSVSIKGIGQLIPDDIKFIELLDIGTGGGELLAFTAKYLRKKGIEHQLTGIDINPNCITYAKSFENGSVQYKVLDVHDALEQKQYDIIHAGLFFHHFNDEEFIHLLNKVFDNCRLGMVINDLQRHPFAYYSIDVLTKLFSKNRLIKNDAPISVNRAFSKQELITLIEQTKWQNYSIQWQWAFRWLVVLRKNNAKN